MVNQFHMWISAALARCSTQHRIKPARRRGSFERLEARTVLSASLGPAPSTFGGIALGMFRGEPVPHESAMIDFPAELHLAGKAGPAGREARPLRFHRDTSEVLFVIQRAANARMEVDDTFIPPSEVSSRRISYFPPPQSNSTSPAQQPVSFPEDRDPNSSQRPSSHEPQRLQDSPPTPSNSGEGAAQVNVPPPVITNAFPGALGPTAITASRTATAAETSRFVGGAVGSVSSLYLSAAANDAAWQRYVLEQSLWNASADARVGSGRQATNVSDRVPLDESQDLIPLDVDWRDDIALDEESLARQRAAVDKVLEGLFEIGTSEGEKSDIRQATVPHGDRASGATDDSNAFNREQNAMATSQWEAAAGGGMVLLEAEGDPNEGGLVAFALDDAPTNAVVPPGLEASVGLYQAIDVAGDAAAARISDPRRAPIAPSTVNNASNESPEDRLEKSKSVSALVASVTTVLSGALWFNRENRLAKHRGVTF
jgi:hypothetical protein